MARKPLNQNERVILRNTLLYADNKDVYDIPVYSTEFKRDMTLVDWSDIDHDGTVILEGEYGAQYDTKFYKIRFTQQKLTKLPK